ncbi:MAG: hypothetical protein CVU00_02370 [Bacteroidetes bacterium HGW-Bacteroidetes-17]|jgi:hypothetical protein|nr:MAG: hypothetical protein CVU00_02370 [Bacteroidetes bacterium HGW-Bacteroidetes-17]
MKKFRVLVVDDKKDVLKSIRDRIDYNVLIGDEIFNVELSCLDVEVIKDDDDNCKFSNKTFVELHDLCLKPFHLLLLDFGFVQKGIKTDDEILKLKEIKPEKTLRELIDEVVLNPSHLVKQCYQEPKYINRIKKIFIEHNGPLYLYTYIPNKFEEAYTSVDVRKNVTNEHFPIAKINVIDTRKELFNNDQFDYIHDEEKEYYPFLISKFLSKIIQLEISKSIIDQTKLIRTKYIKIRKNNKLKMMSAIMLSLITGVLTPTIMDSIINESYISIVVFTISIALIISFLSIIIKRLEQRNDKLL